MVKYKLINSVSKIETICDKITLDRFDYYVISEEIDQPTYIVSDKTIELVKDEFDFINSGIKDGFYAKVIATNNPNIDIPQIINEGEKLAEQFVINKLKKSSQAPGILVGYIEGYNKAKENYKYTKEDMLNFYDWCDISEEAGRFWRNNRVSPQMGGGHNKILNEKRKELFKIWKEQQPKTLYYE